jgi:2,3-bisphosphoglycerate-independent phosphoglycerate mutase
MKYIVILGDGMGDYSISELGDKTPLQVASTPNMDIIATKGILGLIKTIPDGFPAGSDVSNLEIFGYSSKRYYTGRAPFEAASIGINLTENDVAFRCNLVTLLFKNGEIYMDDFSAGHISTEEAEKIIEEINLRLGGNDIRFYPGVSYRNLMVWENGENGMLTYPPHDIIGKNIMDYLPEGKGDKRIRELIFESQKFLKDLKINKNRINKGLKPANSIWLWGEGKAPDIPTFKEKYNISGSVISAVDLIKGIGIYAGLDVVDVPGVTGYLDTNFYGKADYALNELKEKDFVYIHVEAPDEASHEGDIEKKIKAIEEVDSKVVGTVIEGMEIYSDYKILILTDHFTPVSLKTHFSSPVPFAIYNSRVKKNVVDYRGFDEKSAKNSGIYIKDGFELMNLFI